MPTAQQAQFKSVLNGLRTYRQASLELRKLAASGVATADAAKQIAGKYAKVLAQAQSDATVLQTVLQGGPTANICALMKAEITNRLSQFDPAKFETQASDALDRAWSKAQGNLAGFIAEAHNEINSYFGGIAAQLQVILGLGVHLQSELERITDLVNQAQLSLTALVTAAQNQLEQRVNSDAQALEDLASSLDVRSLADEASRRSAAARQSFLTLQGELNSSFDSLGQAFARSDLSVTVPALDSHGIALKTQITVHPTEGVTKTLSKTLGGLRSDSQAAFTLISGLWDSADGTLATNLQSAPTTKAAQDAIEVWRQALITAVDNLASAPSSIASKVADTAKSWELSLQNANSAFISTIASFGQGLEALRQQFLAQLDDALAKAGTTVNEAKKQVAGLVRQRLDTLKTNILTQLTQPWDDFCNRLLKNITDAVKDLVNGLDLSWAAADVGNLAKNIEQNLAAFEQSFAAATQNLADLAAKSITALVGSSLPSIPTLALQRAFGGAPVVQQLGFNIQQLGYYFGNLPQGVGVGVRPIAALLNRVGDDLKGLGLRLPTRGFLDKVVPDNLPTFDFSDVIPDIAGLKQLLQSAGFDTNSSQYITVTHGVDVQSRRAWAHAHLNNMPLLPKNGGDGVTLFELPGLMRVQLKSGYLSADADASVAANGQVQRRISGSVFGDWAVIWEKPETELVTFDKTTLMFDESGHLSFDIGMDRIHLNEALSFITNILKSITVGSGFSIDPQLPTGIRVHLDIAFPNVGGVTSGIQDLVLGMAFQLNVIPEFSVGISFYIGTRKKPFTIALFILGGTGWCELGVTYYPTSQRLVLNVDAGIGLSASLQIALGPISGQAGISLAFTLNIQKTIIGAQGSGGDVAAGLRLHIWGELSVLSIISAGIYLDFSATYSNGCLTATGSLEIHISICWVINIDISTSVTFTLGSCGSNGGSPRSKLEREPDVLLAWVPNGNEPLRLPAHRASPLDRLPSAFRPFAWEAAGSSFGQAAPDVSFLNAAKEYLSTLEED